VVPTLSPHTKLINAVPEVIRVRPTEFVSQIPKALDPYAALVQRLAGKTVQPIEYRDCVGILLVEDDSGLRQSTLFVCSQYCERMSSVLGLLFRSVRHGQARSV